MISERYSFYVHCPIEAQAERFCEILDALGFVWASGHHLLGYTLWSNRKKKMHYHVNCAHGTVTYSDYPTCNERVYTFDEFIAAYELQEEAISIAELI